ncbi:hypothetical protein Anas_07282 [Armadillidium nasatum]|uniref:Uncharacterized protein n=1 Tax=Armadillidium nasatum TaxID=96803 RepID=A0A5N5SKV2_9CRUS|nr:hypothetical protein Anas_07282 [Armadillidium nasatum]
MFLKYLKTNLAKRQSSIVETIFASLPSGSVILNLTVKKPKPMRILLYVVAKSFVSKHITDIPCIASV